MQLFSSRQSGYKKRIKHNKRESMLKEKFALSYHFQCAWLCLLCLLVLANVGCQRRDEEIAGVSIPIPEKMTKNPDKSFVPIKGFEDGQVSYQGKVPPAEIFTFYQETMAARGWQPNSWFAGQKDQIAYTKGNRVALIYYTPTPDGTTVLTIMVGTQYPPK